MSKEIKHGLPSSYTVQGCRCDICRANWAKYNKKYSKAYHLRHIDEERKRSREYWVRAFELDPEGTREKQKIARDRYSAKKKAAKQLK
jgi:hypothetical protein